MGQHPAIDTRARFGAKNLFNIQVVVHVEDELLCHQSVV